MLSKMLRGTRYYNIEGEGASLKLTYYIIEKVMASGESYYGIEIQEEKLVGHLQSLIGYDQVLLSESLDQVEDIVDKLIGGGVTPVGMDCVVDELVG